MRRIRESIKNNNFQEFAKNFIKNFFSSESYKSNNSYTQNIPDWIVKALKSVNIEINQEN